MGATKAILRNEPTYLTLKYPGEALADDGENRVVFIREFVKGRANDVPVTWEIGTYPPATAAEVRVMIIEVRDELFPGASLSGSRPLVLADVAAIRKAVHARLGLDDTAKRSVGGGKPSTRRRSRQMCPPAA